MQPKSFPNVKSIPRQVEYNKEMRKAEESEEPMLGLDRVNAKKSAESSDSWQQQPERDRSCIISEVPPKDSLKQRSSD
jgi:hypothetical protein